MQRIAKGAVNARGGLSFQNRGPLRPTCHAQTNKGACMLDGSGACATCAWQAASRSRSHRKCRSHPLLHAACDGPVICMDAGRLNLSKNDRSRNGNGLELSERREKHHFFPSRRNKEQIRHVLVGTISFHLMLVATRNLVELVRSRRRLGGVSDTPVEGPISFNGGRERRFLVEQKVDLCFLLCSGRLVHVNFV